MPVTIRNILIANRGEIALRIIRTLQKSGIGAIGVYSENDRHSKWIRLCSPSVSLGSGSIADTYLNSGKIIQAALSSGADAIHPGYGFLSENFRFAESCKEHNIAFIGPSPETLKIAGDKQAANDMVTKLGIAAIEKITGNADELLSMASVIQYPVIAKAVAGGGGKGIRIVYTRTQLSGILKTVSEEAMKSFGDDRVYLERYIDNPRHIEIQILGDTYGNRLHLFERECSVQRRHQKIIEESPAPSISKGLRTSLAKAALLIADHLNFISAGTIEFLVDRDENFWFLEINPRIQVEHGITEMITGIDIVEEQIDIAQGKALKFKQDQLFCKGHATEVRIYSEDPENNMIPLPGTIYDISFPATDNIRIDSAIEPGSEIWPDFDPLLAKIMAYGNNRDQSIQTLKKALEQTSITGLIHNLPLIDLIIDQPDYHNGQLSTTWLENKYPSFSKQIIQNRHKTKPVILAISAALKILKHAHNNDVWTGSYWRIVRQIRVIYDKQLIELDYEEKSSGTTFYHNNDTFHVSSVYTDEPVIEFRLNDEFFKWHIIPEKNGVIHLSDGHYTHVVERFSLNNREFTSSGEIIGSEDDLVKAPQPGTIVDIKVCEGQQVNRGDYLLTIESMKLENIIVAVNTAIVKKIHIKAGDRVKKNEPLMHLQQNQIN